VLGEGGFLAPPNDYFQKISALCRKHGIVFIADEVQTGIARTGTLFACEQYGIEPDILVTAKSLGGGLPIASITGRSEIMDAPGTGGLGGTFTGNPVSCEAALAVLETVQRDNLCLRAQHIGKTFVARATAWQQNWPQVRYIHGLGAMRSIELRRVDDSPADEEVRAISRYCYEHGLLTISAGTYNNIIRLLMPLVISDAQFQEGLNVMEAGLAEVFSGACRPEQKVTCA